MSREIDSIRVEFIESLPGRRQVDANTVARLVESIKRIGLRTPLSVRMVDNFVTADGEVIDGQPVLVTGAHRLEAVRKLGWEKVECFVLTSETDAQARLWEISENLHRAELSSLERDENVAEWIRITEEQSRVSGQSAPKLSNRGRKGEGRPESGIRSAARDLGVESTDAKRAVKVASLTPEAKAAARELKLDDNRTALLMAARAAPARQAEVLREIATEKAVRDDMPERPTDSGYAELIRAWSKASPDARDRFLSHINATYSATQAA
jgi:ParB-like chromosome segregation protein Spo0J